VGSYTEFTEIRSRNHDGADTSDSSASKAAGIGKNREANPGLAKLLPRLPEAGHESALVVVAGNSRFGYTDCVMFA
jgi:phage tail protein X